MFINKFLAAQRDLNTAQANLKATIEKQKALAAMQADFENLKPNIDDICTKLGVFADIWTFVSAFFVEVLLVFANIMVQ